MARGMANNEPIQSQAQNRAFDEGWDRMEHADDGVRGRFVWDTEQKRLVPIAEYRQPERAVDAPILSGRFYEGTKTFEGEDIGSRAKYEAYCRRNGVTNAGDFSEKWYADVKATQKREAKKSRREAIARALYQMDKP